MQRYLKRRFTLLLTIGCVLLATEAKAQPAALTLTVHSSPPACGASSGEISFSATGGTAPYTYTFRGINTSGQTDFTGLGPGTIPITVTDASGATASQTVTLTQTINPPTLSATAYNNPTGCNSMDGSITVTPSGGKPPYLYTIDNINWQTSPTFANLPTSSGPDYITVKDADGCLGYAYNSPTLVGPCPMRIWSLATNTLIFSCGGKTGYIHINGVVGGTAPYAYSLDNITYTTNSNFDNLGAGWYTVYVKDATGNILSETFLINDECAVKATYVTTIADCGSNDGTITVTATGGATPYSYSLDGTDYQMNNNVFTGVAAGTYPLWVKDLYGVTFTTIVTIFDNCPLVTAVATNATCSGNDGTITAQGSNGTAPYQYSLDGTNYQASPIFPNLAPGNYTVYIKDNVAHKNVTTITVGTSCLQLTAIPGNIVCSRPDGTITITGTGGTPPYAYSRDMVTYQSSNVFSGLGAGNYTVYIRDAAATISSTSVTITDQPGPTAMTVTPQGAGCDLTGGGLSVAVVGGTAPYQYSIDGVNWQSGSSFALSPGAYTVEVKDVNGCGLSNGPWTVPELCLKVTATSTDASCTQSGGTITASAGGGTTPYTFSLDGLNWQTDNNFTVALGTYTVTAKDAKGFSVVSQPVVISFINNLTVDAGADQTICQGNAVRLMAVSNGSAYAWTPATGLDDATELGLQASPAATTLYTLTATLGVCQATATVTVNVNPAPVADAGPDTAICYGQSVQLHGSGGVGYAWSPGTWLDNAGIADPVVSRPTESIVYSLSVTDALGCRSLEPDEVAVTVTPPPAISLGHDTAVLADQPVYLDVQDVNNSGFTSYAWSPAEGLNDPTIANPVATVSASTTYTVVAATSNGCEATASIDIKVYSVSDLFVPNAFTPNGDGHNDVLRVIPIGIRALNYFTVFNRWGQRVFTTTNPGTGWDGTVNGVLQPVGTYVWMAGGVNYKGEVVERKGVVVLIR